MNMHATIASDPLALRNKKGEPPLAGRGRFFRDDQGEVFEPYQQQHRRTDTVVGVLELEGGDWLPWIGGFSVFHPRQPTRARALRLSIARSIKKFRKLKVGGDWDEGFAGRVIEWALSLKPAEEIIASSNKDGPFLADSAPEEITDPRAAAIKKLTDAALADPVIAELYAAHRARTIFPDGHTVAMTNPVVDGRQTTTGTCQCGQVFQFGWGEHVKMDCAIEAHWQRFDRADDRSRLAAPGPDYWTYAGDDVLQLANDSVVRMLVEAHRQRRQFPAKHAFLTTHPIEDGTALIVATCACGHVIRFPAGDQDRVDAAMEAHWRRHSNGPMVDMNGTTIVPGQMPSNRKEKRRAVRESVNEQTISNRPVEPPREALSAEAAGSSADDPAVSLSLARSGAEEGVVDEALLGHDLEGVLATGPSKADRLDWDCLRAMTKSAPVDDIVAADVVARKLAFVLALKQPERGFILSTAGWLRLEELKSVFEAGTSPGTYARALEETRSLKQTNDADLRVCANPQTETDACIEGSGAEERAVALLNAGDLPNAPAQHKSDGAEPASVTQSVAGAGSPCAEPPPIGGADEDDDDLSVAWPSYDAFLESKIVSTPMRGIEVPRADLHPWLKEFCKDIVVWAARLGCAAIFAECGLHKTAMQLEWVKQIGRRAGGPTLNVVPLGVRHGFIGADGHGGDAGRLDMELSFIRDAAALGIAPRYIERADQMTAGCEHYITNYESIRDGKLDPARFAAAALDEASVLRSFGSKTFQEFLPLFEKVPFKLVATATPAPNRFKELIHYAGFLGVMDTGQALTRFFQRDSERAGNLTLYPHKVEEFWMWVHSWAAFIQTPSDLGYSDDGYALPAVNVVWHEVPADHSRAEPDRDGQGKLFRSAAAGLSAAASSRRDSLASRVAAAAAIRASLPADAHCLFWHDLEAERQALEVAIPDIVTITGDGMNLERREHLLVEFEEGHIRDFGTKPILSGLGSNFQYHCADMIFVGMPGDGYKFELFYQALKRLQRYGQTRPVTAHVIYSEDQREGRAALLQKWAQDREMRERMSAIIKHHGLDTLPLRDALARTIGVKRVEVRGERFIAVNNDTVGEARRWADDSVDLMITSIPFKNKYEYAERYEDFGHVDDSAHFWEQMSFLTAELYRMLKPGRLFCCHVKDEVEFGAVTGQGVPTIDPLAAEAIMHYRAHGFQYCGEIVILTDVVTENSGTYRLGWSKNAEDSTTMGVGCPEKVLLLRKPQSDRSKGWADTRVTKEKPLCEGENGAQVPYDRRRPIVPDTGYSRARWQIDAHAFWRSSGNRLLAIDDLLALGPERSSKLFPEATLAAIYDYEAHIAIGEELERRGRLPTQFMCLAPGSWHPNVWHDVSRMRTLNMYQAAKGREKHICPLQFEIVDRLIDRYSNPGELVYDPFGGIMTVPFRAILKGRRGAAVELESKYFLDGVHYLHLAEEKVTTPALFDLAASDAANTPHGLSGD